jgi:hypothetical protein
MNILKKKIGNGTNTRFCENQWVSDTPLIWHILDQIIYASTKTPPMLRYSTKDEIMRDFTEPFAGYSAVVELY